MRPTFILLCAGIILGLGVTSSLTSSSTKLPAIDYILVQKDKRLLKVFHHTQMVKEYHIALGFSPKGAKETAGDGKTPEGSYVITHKNAHSRYHLSLKISYPNERDLQKGRKKGGALGGDIMIHGLRNDLGWLGRLHTLRDWTLGCIAVTNPEIEEIYAAVAVGTKVEIQP